MITIYFHKLIRDKTGVEKHSFQVKDFESLFNGIKETFPNLGRYYNDMNHLCNMFSLVYDNKSKIIPSSWFLRNNIPNDVTEIWLVPVFTGSGGRWSRAIIGIAIIAIASYFLGPGGGAAGTGLSAGSAGAGSAAGGAAASIGVQATAGGVTNAVVAQSTAAAIASAAASAAAQVALGIGINLVLSALFINQLKSPQDAGDKQARRNNSLWEGLVNTTDQSVSVALHYGNVRVAGQLLSGAVETIDESSPYTPSKGDQIKAILEGKG